MAPSPPMLTPMEGSALWGRPPSSCGAERALEQALGDLDDLRALRDALQQDGELVAAEARGRVHAAQGRAQAVGDADEQLVAGSVAQRVVDGLEVVEVDERDGHDLVVPRGALQRLLDAVEEQRAVREAGQRVVQRAVAQLGLQLALLGRVADAQHEAAHRAIGAQVGDGDHDGQPEAGRVAHAQRDLARGLCPGEGVDRLRRPPDARARASRRPRRPSGRRPRTSRTAPVRPCSLPSPSTTAIASPECSTSARSSAVLRLRRCQTATSAAMMHAVTTATARSSGSAVAGIDIALGIGHRAARLEASSRELAGRGMRTLSGCPGVSIPA